MSTVLGTWARCNSRTLYVFIQRAAALVVYWTLRLNSWWLVQWLLNVCSTGSSEACSVLTSEISWCITSVSSLHTSISWDHLLQTSLHYPTHPITDAASALVIRGVDRLHSISSQINRSINNISFCSRLYWTDARVRVMYLFVDTVPSEMTQTKNLN